MKVHILRIDLAKHLFQLHGVDRKGRPVLVRRVRREQLLKVLGELEPCFIGIEASTGAFFGSASSRAGSHREDHGLAVREAIRTPAKERQHRTPRPICMAVWQRNMRFVPKKSLEQQDIQALHRARQRLVNHRTALISQTRGHLRVDRGISQSRYRRFGCAALDIARCNTTALGLLSHTGGFCVNISNQSALGLI